MRYYQTNAVYERIQGLHNHSFIWAAGNAWILIYGNGHSEPVALVLVAGRSWEPQSEVTSLVESLSEVSGLLVMEIHFDDTVKEIESVGLKKHGSRLVETSLEDLRAVFSELGLPVKSGAASKAINDASSSAYHNWQRANLGRITVSDIDLFRLDGERRAIELIELKRSYIDLNKWQPFSADYPNFNLILSTAKLSSARMTIAYNVRTKNPFYDDPSSISVFNYAKFNSPIHAGVYPFERFADGSYL
ncbi:hypothetical protein [Shinella sp. BYT-45]|uniref:hypothetical protein n=1 Tax=Shinella sp. BYT-45 TaxID=3377377 RepID=UPI00398021CE